MIALVCVTAAFGNDTRLELRHRLDSLEVEKQTLKRQGKAIEELEAAAAAMRDSLIDLRTHDPETAAAGGAESGSPFDKLPFLRELTSLRPRGGFDWVVIGTGLIAVLSLLVLVIGLAVGRKRSAGQKKRVVSRRINLAPTGSQTAVPEPRIFSSDKDADILPAVPAAPLYKHNGQTEKQGLPPWLTKDADNDAEPRDRTSDIQSLVETLRKVAPPPEEESPPPLVADAPEEPPPSQFKGFGTGLFPAASKDSAIPSFKELVIAADKNGLSETEISRRYQLSVDQVRLILRMNK